MSDPMDKAWDVAESGEDRHVQLDRGVAQRAPLAARQVPDDDAMTEWRLFGWALGVVAALGLVLALVLS